MKELDKMNNMDEKQIPQVSVGIMNEPMIDFVLNGDYRVNGAACSGAGKYGRFFCDTN